MPTGNFKKEDLNTTLKQIHHASQLIAAINYSFKEDESSINELVLGWNKEYFAFESKSIGPNNKFKVGLEIKNLAYIILTNDNQLVKRKSLNGKTFDLIFENLRNELEALEVDENKLNIQLPYTIPFYPTKNGMPFSTLDSDSFGFFAEFYNIIFQVLNEVKEELPTSTQVGCWAHKMDVAFHFHYKKDENDLFNDKSIAVGISPGDEWYKEHYAYVHLWPNPNMDEVPSVTLPFNAHWHNKQWFGAALKLDNYDIDQYRSHFKPFVNEAVRILESL